MTLVVGRTTPGGVRLASDLRVTDEQAVRSGYMEGVLKAVLLHTDLCVAFAGNVGVGLGAVRRCADLLNRDDFEFDEVKQTLLNTHRDTGGSTDFLVAVRRPASLTRVAHGELQPAESTWIGDHDAFRAYQEHYLSAVTPPVPPGLEDRAADLEVAVRMSEAMRRVVNDHTIATVGESMILIASEPEGLRYQPVTMMTANHEQTIPSGEWTTLEFGSAAQGGFAYTVLVPDGPGIGAVGLHFFQGQVGLLYYPAKVEKPELFPNVSHDAFRAQVAERFGIAIQGNVVG